jgi:hypothetical protein
MGRRDPNRMRIVPQWMSTLQRMKEWRTHVRVICSNCGDWSEVNIDPLIECLGWDGSLWDRRPPCENGGCDALMTFHASPAPGTPFRLLASGVAVDDLPAQAWMGGWLGLPDYRTRSRRGPLVDNR